MKVIVIYKPNSEHATNVESFLRDFSRQTGKTIETLDPDTREGISFCQTYDILHYPTIIAVDDNGVMQNVWGGEMLPTISEVGYYA